MSNIKDLSRGAPVFTGLTHVKIMKCLMSYAIFTSDCPAAYIIFLVRLKKAEIYRKKMNEAGGSPRKLHTSHCKTVT
jgi:hypothetical protein